MLVSIVSEKGTFSVDVSTFRALGGVVSSSMSGLISTREREGSGCAA